MTDLEKRHEKAEALLSFHEAQENRDAMRTKINRIRRDLCGVCDWLKRLESAETSAELVRTEFYSDTFQAQINVLGNSAFREAMDYNATAVGLQVQMAGALRRVEETAQNKQALRL